MLATLALSAVLFANQGAQHAEPTPAQALIAKMLAYYHEAKTLTGSIALTATDGAGRAALVTTVQFEKPSKLFIRQTKAGTNPQTWYITSNGKVFSYAAPENLPGSRPGTTLVSDTPGARPNRLIENVQEGATTYDIKMIYAIGAPDSLADRSVPLDIAICRREDLEHDVRCWDSPTILGKQNVNGKEANVITGAYRRYGNAPISGNFELDIADDGSLVRYVVKENMGDKERQVLVTSIWDVDLQVNGKPDESLFKVVQ